MLYLIGRDLDGDGAYEFIQDMDNMILTEDPHRALQVTERELKSIDMDYLNQSGFYALEAGRFGVTTLAGMLFAPLVMGFRPRIAPPPRRRRTPPPPRPPRPARPRAMRGAMPPMDPGPRRAAGRSVRRGIGGPGGAGRGGMEGPMGGRGGAMTPSGRGGAGRGGAGRGGAGRGGRGAGGPGGRGPGR